MSRFQEASVRSRVSSVFSTSAEASSLRTASPLRLFPFGFVLWLFFMVIRTLSHIFCEIYPFSQLVFFRRNWKRTSNFIQYRYPFTHSQHAAFTNRKKEFYPCIFLSVMTTGYLQTNLQNWLNKNYINIRLIQTSIPFYLHPHSQMPFRKSSPVIFFFWILICPKPMELIWLFP